MAGGLGHHYDRALIALRDQRVDQAGAHLRAAERQLGGLVSAADGEPRATAEEIAAALESGAALRRALAAELQRIAGARKRLQELRRLGGFLRGPGTDQGAWLDCRG